MATEIRGLTKGNGCKQNGFKCGNFLLFLVISASSGDEMKQKDFDVRLM